MGGKWRAGRSDFRAALDSLDGAALGYEKPRLQFRRAQSLLILRELFPLVHVLSLVLLSFRLNESEEMLHMRGCCCVCVCVSLGTCQFCNQIPSQNRLWAINLTHGGVDVRNLNSGRTQRALK